MWPSGFKFEPPTFPALCIHLAGRFEIRWIPSRFVYLQHIYNLCLQPFSMLFGAWWFVNVLVVCDR